MSKVLQEYKRNNHRYLDTNLKTDCVNQKFVKLVYSQFTNNMGNMRKLQGIH